MQKTAMFVEATERVFVRPGGFKSTAFVRAGVCVRSVTTDSPSGVVVQTLSGENMVNDYVGMSEADLRAAGFMRASNAHYWIGPDGREFDRLDDGGYICTVIDEKTGDMYDIVYDIAGRLI